MLESTIDTNGFLSSGLAVNYKLELKGIDRVFLPIYE